MPEENRIEKPWGHEEILYETDDLVVLRVYLDGGEETSLHKHRERDETFVILSGSGRLSIEGEEDNFEEQDVLAVLKGQRHRWFADEDVELLEVTTPPLEDSIRVGDKYGRSS